MKGKSIVLGAILFMATIATFAGNGKLSAWISMQLLEQPSRQRAASEVAESDMLLTTFIRLAENARSEILTEHGCKVYAQLGDIYIVTVPMSQLEALLSQEEVLRIEANTTCQTTMDSVAKVVNVLPAYQPTSQRQGYTGKGVVLGVMDVGFDLTHPTFYDDKQQSRIKAFWDQLATTTDHEAGPVGSIYNTPTAIQTAGCSTDGKMLKHGSHTLGIAAGTGYTTAYRGIAYDSDLCLVANAVTSDTCFIDKRNYNLYTSATDALGFKFIFDYAAQQGKPCVISFSEGYTPYMDEDDALYNEFLKRLTGPGRILVSSAGNENVEYTSMEKPAGMEQAGSFVRVFKDKALYRLLTAGTPTLRLKAYSGVNTVCSEISLLLDADSWEEQRKTDTLWVGTDTVAISLTAYTSELINDKTMYQMELTSNRSLDALLPIAMVLEGSEADVLLYGSSRNALTSHEWDSRWTAAQRRRNVLAPGCLEAPICVGATAWRMDCLNMAGEIISNTGGGEVGQVAYFSSSGPTLDERLKPEVLAPGKNVISSLSSYYLAEHPEQTWDLVATSLVNGRTYPWGVNSGTSMSTPVVAGAIALWLQAKPTLTREEIIDILQKTCNHNDPTLFYPNEYYGYGEIDIEKGLEEVMNSTGIIDVHQTADKAQSADSQTKYCYDLQGRRVSKPSKRGVYIINGKLRIY